MKIWWQSSTPIHRLHDYRTTLSEHLNSVKRPETDLHINGVDDGSMDLHYNAVVAMNSYGSGGVLNKIIQGAEVILAACATVNAIIRREKIHEVDGALILDCNAVLLKVTEGMAELGRSIGLHASQRLLYQRPNRRSLDDWMRIYGFCSSAQLKP